MEVIRTIAELRNKVADLKQMKKPANREAIVGFVPTMGYLHQGHMSLMERARDECEIVILSIFVNPLQFGQDEDYDTYPRDEQHDLNVAERMAVDIVFIPSAEEMYPRPMKTNIYISELTDRLCGAVRPGHFDGVATVVMKLFHIVEADKAYFGMKDAQQVAVIQQMVHDLNMPVEIVPCPILREPDGLAMSSRNVYLNGEERSQSLVLSQVLQVAQNQITKEDWTIGQLTQEMSKIIRTQPLAVIDYIEICSFPGLEAFGPTDRIQHLLQRYSLLIALAVKLGTTRLIDNVVISR